MRGDALLADELRKGCRHGNQHGVADGVTVGVVDPLEVVNVQGNQGEWLARCFRSLISVCVRSLM